MSIGTPKSVIQAADSEKPSITYAPFDQITGYHPIMGFHRHLLEDKARTNPFLRAIEMIVQPGDVVVVDLGAGTGILAMACCRAQAKRVYAVEVQACVLLAEKAARQNGFDADQFIAMRGHSKDLTLPEKVDVIVSECLGLMGPSGMMLSVIDFAKRSLKPRGRLIPERVSSYLVPVESPLHYEYVHAWDNQRLYGFDFSAFQTIADNNVYIAWFKESAFLSEPDELVTNTLLHDDLGDISTNIEFIAKRDGILHGYAGWFVAELGEGILLDGSPSAEQTIWQQVYLPLGEAMPVKAGQRIQVDFGLSHRVLCGALPGFHWHTTVGEKTLEQSTTRSHPARARGAWQRGNFYS